VTLIAGVYAGAVVVYLVMLPPLMAVLTAPQGVEVKRRIDPLNDKIWPPVLAPAMVMSGLLLIFDDADSTATVLTAVGLVGLVAVPLTTVRLVIPVNKRIHALDAGAGDASTDSEFRSLHDRWAKRHTIRLAFALVAFAAFTIALALD
jgi:uncharacterized membrane protein